MWCFHHKQKNPRIRASKTRARGRQKSTRREKNWIRQREYQLKERDRSPKKGHLRKRQTDRREGKKDLRLKKEISRTWEI